MGTSTENLRNLAEVFLLNKRVSDYAACRIEVSSRWLRESQIQGGGAVVPLTVHRFFSSLQARQLASTTIHQAYRTLKA